MILVNLKGLCAFKMIARKFLVMVPLRNLSFGLKVRNSCFSLSLTENGCLVCLLSTFLIFLSIFYLSMPDLEINKTPMSTIHEIHRYLLIHIFKIQSSNLLFFISKLFLHSLSLNININILPP